MSKGLPKFPLKKKDLDEQGKSTFKELGIPLKKRKR